MNSTSKFFAQLKRAGPKTANYSAGQKVEQLYNEKVNQVIERTGFPDEISLFTFLALVSLHDLPRLRTVLLSIKPETLTPPQFKFFIGTLLKNNFSRYVVELLEGKSLADSELISCLAIGRCELGNLEQGISLFNTIEKNDCSRPVNLNYLLELNVAMKEKPSASIFMYLMETKIQDLETKTLTLLMLRSFLNGNQTEFDGIYKDLHRRYSNGVFPSSKTERTFCTAYFDFIQNLIRAREFPKSEHSLPIFGVIGESHCIPWHGLQIEVLGRQGTAISSLIFGAKAFHFKPAEENRHKSLLDYHLWRLREKCAGGLEGIIFIFGEIDCRVDEGITAAIIKGKGNLETVIEGTVGDYVQVLAEIVHKHNLRKILICGVPAPSKENLEKKNATEHEANLVRSVIVQFNRRLQATTLERGFYFIDLYAMTVGEGGWAEATRHVDGVHIHTNMIKSISNFVRIPT